mmetsp:Transcript_2042/g.8186  ORF Transcript_2042/g.8186 Transcript_2042/m.8186 type:complete len:211 (+) Transcript_2042:424-1056(+)
MRRPIPPAKRRWEARTAEPSTSTTTTCPTRARTRDASGARPARTRWSSRRTPRGSSCSTDAKTRLWPGSATTSCRSRGIRAPRYAPGSTAGCRRPPCFACRRSPPCRCTDATGTTATARASRWRRAGCSRASPRARRAGARSFGRTSGGPTSWATWPNWREPRRPSRRRLRRRRSPDGATVSSRRSTRRCAREPASGARCTSGATASGTR